MMTSQTLRNLERGNDHDLCRLQSQRNRLGVQDDDVRLALCRPGRASWIPLITVDEVIVKKVKGHSIVIPLGELEFKADI